MAEFVTELDPFLKPGSDTVWVLKSPLIFISDLVGRIKAPTDFETDFASVPRVPIIYSMWGGRVHREAVIHDLLFRLDSDPLVGFWMANRVFLEAMRARGKPYYIKYPMYCGVCIGAYGSFHRRSIYDKLD